MRWVILETYDTAEVDSDQMPGFTKRICRNDCSLLRAVQIGYCPGMKRLLAIAALLPFVLAAFAFALGGQSAPVIAAEPLSCPTARLIVPARAGAGSDLVARIFVEAANAAGAKPPLRVINMEGQDGLAGINTARAAIADGCTLLMTSQQLVTAYLNGQIQFEWKAFRPLAQLSHTPAILAVSAATETASLLDWLDLIKADRSNGSVAVEKASVRHYFFMELERETELKLTYQFSRGAWAHLTKIRENSVAAALVNLAMVKKYNTETGIRVIGTSSEEIARRISGVRTFASQGVPIGFGIDRGLFLPEGPKREVVEHYEKIFSKAARNPAVIAALRQHGVLVRYLNSDRYTKYHEDLLANWRPLAVKAGIFNGG